jgi:hypothetical protein
LGNLSTPKTIQKLQKALHAKAKAEAGYRFYALYDKISREDILTHAFAQCRSNKGALGIDGEDFADIETYGVKRGLGELALALREENYRPDPIRRVFIPKANGKLRPLGISTVRDRVCMTATMLVLEPIFEADFHPTVCVGFGKCRRDHAPLCVGQIGLVSGDNAAMLSSSCWRPHGETKLVQVTIGITAGASDTTLFQKLPLTKA